MIIETILIAFGTTLITQFCVETVKKSACRSDGSCCRVIISEHPEDFLRSKAKAITEEDVEEGLKEGLKEAIENE